MLLLLLLLLLLLPLLVPPSGQFPALGDACGTGCTASEVMTGGWYAVSASTDDCPAMVTVNRRPPPTPGASRQVISVWSKVMLQSGAVNTSEGAPRELYVTGPRDTGPRAMGPKEAPVNTITLPPHVPTSLPAPASDTACLMDRPSTTGGE